MPVWIPGVQWSASMRRLAGGGNNGGPERPSPAFAPPNGVRTDWIGALIFQAEKARAAAKSHFSIERCRVNNVERLFAADSPVAARELSSDLASIG